MPNSSSPSKPRGGAPAGNRNALKHGFYSRQLNRQERLDLAHHPFSGLQDEIALLRIQIRRLMEHSASTSNLFDSIDLTRALAFASAALCRLIDTHNACLLSGQSLDPVQDEEHKAIRAEFKTLLAEHGWPDPHADQP